MKNSFLLTFLAVCITLVTGISTLAEPGNGNPNGTGNTNNNGNHNGGGNNGNHNGGGNNGNHNGWDPDPTPSGAPLPGALVVLLVGGATACGIRTIQRRRRKA